MLATAFPANSMMIEALCLFGNTQKARQELPETCAFEACVTKKPSRLPTANWAGSPEANFARRGVKSRPGKTWMPRILPEDEVLSWASDNEEEVGTAAPSQWTCPKCTFANSMLLPACEMCEHARGQVVDTEGAAIACNGAGILAPVAPRSDVLMWPSLSNQQASRDDAASECSSWLDVAEEKSLAEHDLDGWSVTSEVALEGLDTWSVASEPPAKPLSWAALAGETPSMCMAAKPVAHPARQREQQRRLLARRAAAAEKAIAITEDEDDVVVLLEERRLNPTSSRGSTHRRRLGKRM